MFNNLVKKIVTNFPFFNRFSLLKQQNVQILKRSFSARQRQFSTAFMANPFEDAML